MPNVTFNLLMGGGDTIITQNRIGNKTTSLTPDQLTKIVHLSGIPFSINELRLIQLCQDLSIPIVRIQYAIHQHGPLEGQPKGFAWIECVDATAAQFAIQILNGYQINNRALKAALYSPDTQGTTITGFATLKQKQKDGNTNGDNNAMGDGNGQNQQQNVDGVPYNIFLQLCEQIDEDMEDDYETIFDLPALERTKDGAMVIKGIKGNSTAR